MVQNLLRCFAASGLCILPLGAQQSLDWALHQPWLAGPLAPAAMAVDPASGRPVRFGGYQDAMGYCPDLWEWRGDRWARRWASPGPELRSNHAMAADTSRRQVVLFGGAGATSRDTWTWDGARWRAHATPLLLAVRTGHAMAFDAWRGRVVLFGGLVGNTYNGVPLGDTWEWDGVGWILCQPGAPPAPRHGHRLAFDAARGRVVLFGGRVGTSTLFGDTWEWDGTFWTPRFPMIRPAARAEHGLAYDPARQRTVLFGGSALPLGPSLSDTWEWNGTAWSEVQPAHRPPAHSGHALLHDPLRGRIVLFGATSGADDVWEYDGLDWQQLPQASSPAPRSFASLVHDPLRGESVLFGGIAGSTNASDTWTWNGDRWTAAVPATSPSARNGHAAAFDAVRGVLLLFGGTTSAYYYAPAPNDETWSWNGATWTAVQPAHRPPPRLYHGLAWHRGSQQVVLFGGRDSSTTAMFDDTWAWDGTDWTQQQPTTSPPARFLPAMAGHGPDVVMFGGGVFGGSGSTASLADTWRWNGASWIQVQPATSPPGRHYHALAEDAGSGRVLMTGGIAGTSGSQTFADTWSWDGIDWSLVGTDTTPKARMGLAMAGDAQRRMIVTFGGFQRSDTWVLAAAGVESAFGAGCAGTLGVPALQPSPHSLPELGGTVIADLANVPGALAAAVLGFSDSTTGSSPLPLPLGPFGMPGCDLLVSTDGAVLLLANGNVATFVLPVPQAGALRGVVFFLQGFAFDPGINLAGLTASNGVRCTLGN